MEVNLVVCTYSVTFDRIGVPVSEWSDDEALEQLEHLSQEGEVRRYLK